MQKLAALLVLEKQRQFMQVWFSCSCCRVAYDHGAWGCTLRGARCLDHHGKLMPGAMSIHACMCVTICVAYTSWTRHQVMCLRSSISYFGNHKRNATTSQPTNITLCILICLAALSLATWFEDQSSLHSDVTMLPKSWVFPMQRFQSKDMDDQIKCYRQAMFKLDHVKRKRVEDVAYAANLIAFSWEMHSPKPKHVFSFFFWCAYVRQINHVGIPVSFSSCLLYHHTIVFARLATT